MSETPEELRELIARAKNAGPGPARLASVRARLESQLGPLDAPRALPPALGAPVALGSTRAALGVVAVVALIAIGAWLGTRSPAAEPSAAPSGEIFTEPVRAPEHASGVEPAPEPTIDAPRSPSVAEPEALAVVPGETDAPIAPRRAERPASLTPIDPPEALDPASSLREEIALLDRALRASEAGDPARARQALDEHRARFPSGTLSPERDRMLSELPREQSEGSAAPAPP